MLLVLAAITFPAGLTAAGADLDRAQSGCIDSVLDYLEGRGAIGPVMQRVDESDTRADCVDFFSEQLAAYEADNRTERGKPPPKPAPSFPPGRYWHAFAGNGSEVPSASRLYLFGGDGGVDTGWTRVAPDLWYFSPLLGEWQIAPVGRSKPGPRAHMALSCGAGQCVVSHGSDGASLLDETWTYVAATSTWTPLKCARNACPVARLGPAMAYDPERFYHVFFGGFNGRFSLDDTFTFAAGRWTARQPKTRPYRRDRAAMAFVSGPVNAVLLHGGLIDERHNWCDLFAWSGSDWTEISADGPCLHSHSMAWNGNQLVLTGGYVDTDGTPNSEVYYFTFSGPSSGIWSRDSGSAFAACVDDADPGARSAYDTASGKFAFFGGLYDVDGIGAVATDRFVTCH
jgi:hypothetical protein